MQQHSGTTPDADQGHVSLWRITLGDALMAGAGLLIFFGSFLPFVAYREEFRGPFTRNNMPTSFNAWDSETFMAPLTIFVALAGLLIVALVAVRVMSARELRLGSFTFRQLEVVVAGFAALCLAGYAMSTKSMYFGTQWSESIVDGYESAVIFSIGGYVMLAGALLGCAAAFFTLGKRGPVLLEQTLEPHTF